MYGYQNPTVKSTEGGELVGPKMHTAVRKVSRKVYSSKNELAQEVGPNGSSKYGYKIINRCIRKGLITHPMPNHVKSNPHGRGAIDITDKGKAYLNSSE